MGILDLPPYALWLLGVAALGWFAGPLIGYRLARVTQKQSRRHGFRCLLSVHLDKFQHLAFGELHAGDLFKLHEESCAAIIPEAVKIEEDVLWWRRSRFTESSTVYRSLRLEDVEPRDIGTYPEGDHMKFLFPEQYDVGRKKIIDLLSRMRNYAR